VRGAPEPWALDPHGLRRDGNGLSEAIRLARTAARRAPVEADAPRCSTLPMTPAARAALQLSRGPRFGDGPTS
jgi:hypothetical protein